MGEGRAEDGEDVGNPGIRVLLVDDHEYVRTALAELLSEEEGFTVVGECADGSQVVEAVARLRPDVVIMDLAMPVMDGVAATVALRDADPQPRVLMLTADGHNARPRAAAAGAHAVVPKGSRVETLLACLRGIVRGAEPCPYCL